MRKKDKQNIYLNVDFLSFCYIALTRLKRGKTPTLWDFIDICHRVSLKIDYLSRTKNIIFRDFSTLD